MIAALSVRDRGSDPSFVVKFGSTWQSVSRYFTTSFLFLLKHGNDIYIICIYYQTVGRRSM